MSEVSINMSAYAEDIMNGKFLAFCVESRDYGIEIRYVTEIVKVQDITPVPNTHDYLKGIINLRGSIVPVIDMRLRFALPEKEYGERTCIVVLSYDEMTIGLIVDEVQEVIIIDSENIQPPPQITGNNISNYFIRAIGQHGDSVKQLLDIEKVFGTAGVGS